MDSGSDHHKDIIVIVVVLIVLLLLVVGGSVALYYLVIKKDHVVERVECSASEYGWADREDAIKSAPVSVQKQYHDCKSGLCKQEICLSMKDTCWAPVFSKPGQAAVPWCFKQKVMDS